MMQVRVKENQVRVLSDPVTVSRELFAECHCTRRYEKARNDDDLQARKPAEECGHASEEG